MLIDFSQIKEVKIPGMNDGTGEMSARMYMDEQGKIIPTTIHSGCLLYTSDAADE